MVMLFGSEKSNTSVSSIIADSDSITLNVLVVSQPFSEVTVTEYVPI